MLRGVSVFVGGTHNNYHMENPVAETGLLIFFGFLSFSKEMNSYMHLLVEGHSAYWELLNTVPGAFTHDNSLTPHSLQTAFENVKKQAP